MNTDLHGKKRLLLPVRRKLALAAIAYLAGIYAAVYALIPPIWIIGLCAFLLGWAAWRLTQRKSALLCIMGILLLMGNGLAGRELTLRDMPTRPGVQITGCVSAIEKPYRVYLRDAEVEGKSLAGRDVLVTLMREDEAGEDDVPDVFVGQTVSGTGRLFGQDEARNPGGVDRRIQALVDGYDLSGYILPGWTAEGSGRFSLREWFRGLRERLLARTGSVFGERAALFQGVMLGDKSALSSEVSHAMRLTGTVHVLTVSGMHLGMIASVLSAMMQRSGLGRYARLGVLGAALGFFACLTGGAAGTVRALIMALLRELARVRGRDYEPLTALSLAALLMTLARPLWALDASFQFSFFVMLGISLLEQGISARIKKLHMPARLRWSLGMVSVSASAQIAALPMQLMFYGYVPVLALPMNLLCGMIMPLLLLGGWLCTLVSFLPAWVYGMPAALLSRVGGWFEAVSVTAASVRHGVLRLPAPYAVSVFGFAVLMALVSSHIRFGKRRKSAVAVVFALLTVSYLLRFSPAPRYVQLDVGQGDAALFRSGRRAVLVDVGPADSYDMLRYLRHEGLDVEAVILSHLDEDHAGALGVLADSEVEIPCVILAEGARSYEITAAVQAGLDALEAQGAAVYEVRRGDRIGFGSLNLDVLAPAAPSPDSNAHSLLLYAQMGGACFLLTGDMPQESEPADIPDCDVLKVAHHGSRKATSQELLEKAKPEIALISVGAGNSYRHPSAHVLEALQEAGSKTLRTDETGCITLWLDEGVRRVQCFIKQR